LDSLILLGFCASGEAVQDCRIEVGFFFDCAGWNPSTGTAVLRVQDLGVALMNKRVFSIGLAYNAD
jgi:hypothetical protein